MMNTTEHPNHEQPKKASIPRWMALIVFFVFWFVGIPLFYVVGPWAISLFTPRYGWAGGRPVPWNLLGLILVAAATICLTWLMVLHIAQAPERVQLELTPSYLLKRGPYAFSRHPMYLSELALLFGWAIFYGSVGVFLAFIVACLFFNFILVPREELTLEAHFGEGYREYKNKVPRWFGKRRM